MPSSLYFLVEETSAEVTQEFPLLINGEGNPLQTVASKVLNHFFIH
jgi:hypothetical protein